MWYRDIYHHISIAEMRKSADEVGQLELHALLAGQQIGIRTLQTAGCTVGRWMDA